MTRRHTTLDLVDTSLESMLASVKAEAKAKRRARIDFNRFLLTRDCRPSAEFSALDKLTGSARRRLSTGILAVCAAALY